MNTVLRRAASSSRLHLANTPVVTAVLGHRCRVCGRRALRGRRWKLAQELVASWQISPHWRRLFEHREGLQCLACGSVTRYRHLATVVLDELGAGSMGFENFADYTDSDHFKQLEVAEINGCSALHQFLRRHPALCYSEYGSREPEVPSEDLLDLSYRDCQFDLVLTSDTLEHVPDLSKALSEIERILKPGGRHIFTVPTVWDGRKTRQRALLEAGRVIHLHPPSYHGVWSAQSMDRLVFFEFGSDVLEYLKTENTETTIRRGSSNPTLIVFVTVKKPGADRETT